MASQKDILSTLTKARLLELAAAFEIDGLSGRPKDAVVDALARSRRVSTEDLLVECYREELKGACRALSLDDSGRAKQPIIDRLLAALNGGGSTGKGRRDRSISSGGSAAGAAQDGRRQGQSRKSNETRSMAKKKSVNKRAIEQYDHSDKQRVNNPPVGLVTPQTDPDQPERKQYQYDPHLDPQLVWAGKAERTSFEVPTQSLHVHERIDPRTIIEAVRSKNGNGRHQQPSLFETEEENPPLRNALDFYKHSHNWTNRLIAGDSLLVMNSLLEKEGMAGKVQMVYIDPPYGITYGSNFQPFVNRRQVQDRKDDDLTQEPEMIRAFRDTWELGIHSYLTYLRDRLLLAHKLLADNGSCFVQIGDENLHLIRNLMDEVFGPDNFVLTIIVKKKGASTATDPVNDYVVWFVKDRSQLSQKVKRLYQARRDPRDDSKFNTLVSPAGDYVRTSSLSRDEIDDYLDRGYHWARVNWPLVSQDPNETRSHDFHWNGKTFSCGNSRHWTYDPDTQMKRLAIAGRIFDGGGNSLGGVVYWDDWPYITRSNMWDDLHGEQEIIYVVQTNRRIVERCMLMATDPGDLVIDPTCGAGTTPFVAEQWGRRWIACDTSRVAVTLSKKRIMCAHYPYYQLAHPSEGIGSGFEYTVVKRVTLKSIADNPDIQEGMSYSEIREAITRNADPVPLYDQPVVDTGRVRVAGPFTVEAVPAASVRPLDSIQDYMVADESVGRSGPTIRQDEWRQELLNTGVRGRGRQTIEFARVEPLGGTRYLHAQGETKPTQEGDAKRVVVSFGPEHAPLEQRQVEQAWEEARTLTPKPDMLIFAAFQFDPEAAKDIDGLTPEKAGMTFLKAQMNADLLTEDLKKKRSSNESFWLIGQPDVQVRKATDADGDGAGSGTWEVEVQGFDYYDPRTGKVDSGGKNKIAMWMLDTDYDGRSLYPRQVFFPMAGQSEGWTKLAKSLKAEIDQEKIESYRGTTSLPFEAGEHNRIAVKIIDDRGIESLKVVELI